MTLNRIDTIRNLDTKDIVWHHHEYITNILIAMDTMIVIDTVLLLYMFREVRIPISIVTQMDFI